MMFSSISDVIKFVADEITGGRKRDISFSVTSDRLVASDFLNRIIEYCPPLLLCIKGVNYQLRNLGVVWEYKLIVEYTNVMPACVSYVVDKNALKEEVLSCAMLHRRELFVVFRDKLCDTLLSASKDFTKDPGLLSCYLQGVRCELKRMSGCTYCGLKVMLSYSCSYKEYRSCISELNRVAVEIIHEAKQAVTAGV